MGVLKIYGWMIHRAMLLMLWRDLWLSLILKVHGDTNKGDRGEGSWALPWVFQQLSPPLFNLPMSVRNWLCPPLSSVYTGPLPTNQDRKFLQLLSYTGYKASLLAIKVVTSGSTVGVFLNVLFMDKSCYLWPQEWGDLIVKMTPHLSY